MDFFICFRRQFFLYLILLVTVGGKCSSVLESTSIDLVPCFTDICANPDAKRLYDDLLSNYNSKFQQIHGKLERYEMAI